MSEFFNKNLKFLRTKKGLSQEKLAKMIGKDRSSIAYWELGKSEPSIDNVIKISNVLNVPIYDLTGKDLTKEDIDESSQLDELLFSKAKELSDEDKKMILNIINAIKREVDKEENSDWGVV